MRDSSIVAAALSRGGPLSGATRGNTTAAISGRAKNGTVADRRFPDARPSGWSSASTSPRPASAAALIAARSSPSTWTISTAGYSRSRNNVLGGSRIETSGRCSRGRVQPYAPPIARRRW